MPSSTETKSLPAAKGSAQHRRSFATVVARVGQKVLSGMPSALPIAIKLALVIGLLITLVMGLLGALLVYNQSRIMGDQIAMSGRSMALQLAEAAKEPTLASDQLALSVLVNNLTGGGTTVLGAAVLDETGKLLSQAGAVPFSTEQVTDSLWPLLNEQLREFDWEWRGTRETPVEVVTYATPLRYEDVTAGYALVTLSRSLMNQSLYDLMRTIGVATLVMILLGFVLSFLLARRLSRPIMELVDAGRAMSEGRYQHRISERRNDEIGNLIGAFNSMADGLLHKAQVEDAFSRYVSPTVARNILSNLGDVELGGQRIDGSILFADIAGFTSLSERMKPEQVAELLNEYFSYIARASSVYNGVVDKYIGDCAMIVFGVPDEDPEHSFNAVACASLIRAVVKRLNERRRSRGQETVEFRFGINAGQMLAGNMGSRDRMQYTVVGDTVNLASRLCTYAESGCIVISRELYARPPVFKRLAAHQHRDIKVRGKSEPVAIYEVDCFIEPYNGDIERQADKIVSRHLWPLG
ncbi:MAG: HAMP domain-containing protein [Proteobacteria bacterium]|nr:MAG: HAMP domain-containing protein [Pseudomonadota bacterium]